MTIVGVSGAHALPALAIHLCRRRVCGASCLSLPNLDFSEAGRRRAADACSCHSGRNRHLAWTRCAGMPLFVSQAIAPISFTRTSCVASAPINSIPFRIPPAKLSAAVLLLFLLYHARRCCVCGSFLFKRLYQQVFRGGVAMPFRRAVCAPDTARHGAWLIRRRVWRARLLTGRCRSTAEHNGLKPRLLHALLRRSDLTCRRRDGDCLALIYRCFRQFPGPASTIPCRARQGRPVGTAPFAALDLAGSLFDAADRRH